jgi:hypothetical protein
MQVFQEIKIVANPFWTYLYDLPTTCTSQGMIKAWNQRQSRLFAYEPWRHQVSVCK